MSTYSAFIIYLSIFRLAVIAAGIISIVLGYYLFTKGVFPETSGKGTEADAQFGSVKLTLKNAAPGTVFAFFGAAIIIFMLVRSPPELTTKMVENAEGAEMRVEVRSAGAPSKLEGNKLTSFTDLAIKNEEEGQFSEARDLYEKAVLQISKPMNGLAWRYFKEGKLDNALKVSEIAVSLSPQKHNFLDTYGEILLSLERYTKAIEVMEAAVRLDSRYDKKLLHFKEIEKIEAGKRTSE